jgi:hypothetical protein
LLSLVLGLAVGLAFGYLPLKAPEKGQAPQQQNGQSASQGIATPQGKQATNPSKPDPTRGPDEPLNSKDRNGASEGQVEVRNGGNPNWPRQIWLILGSGVLAVGAFYGLRRRYSKLMKATLRSLELTDPEVTYDSEVFIKALDIWHDVIASRYQSPRAIVSVQPPPGSAGVSPSRWPGWPR